VGPVHAPNQYSYALPGQIVADPITIEHPFVNGLVPDGIQLKITSVATSVERIAKHRTLDGTLQYRMAFLYASKASSSHLRTTVYLMTLIAQKAIISIPSESFDET